MVIVVNYLSKEKYYILCTMNENGTTIESTT